MDDGLVVIVSGPSGCGKGTIVSYLRDSDKIDFALTKSDTSREKRPGDPNDAYNFISREEFESRIRASYYLEYNEFAGNYYGTPIAQVETAREARKVTLLEVNVDGALNIRKRIPAAKLIFIQSPGRITNIRRLRHRGTSWYQVYRRTAESFREYVLAPFFDHREVNFTNSERQIADTIEALIVSGQYRASGQSTVAA